MDPDLLKLALEHGLTVEWSKIHKKYIAFAGGFYRNETLVMADNPFRAFEEGIKELVKLLKKKELHDLAS